MKNTLMVVVTVLYSLLANLSVAQTAAVDNKLFETITFHPIPKGPTVFGVFEGRPPCGGLAGQLGVATDADCVKLKCVLTLYRDSITSQPSTYSLYIVGGGDVIKQEGGSYRQKTLEGKWEMAKGTKSNLNAEVYRLELGKSATYFYLLKGDENVLFVLDENKEFRVGNGDFSYTLNRVELVPGNK